MSNLRRLPARTAVLRGFDPALVLDLDFRMGSGNDIGNANNRDLRYGLPVPITYTGADNGTYFDGSGVLQTSGADEPRFDHDPVSGAPLGLLIEAAAAQLNTNPEDFGSWIENGGASVSTDVATAPDGNVTADNLVLASGGASWIQKTVTGLTSAGTEYTYPVYVRVASGTEDFRLGMWDNVDGDQYETKTVTTEWQQFPFTRTYNGASTARVISIWNEAAGGVKTLQVWGANLTASSFASSYIPVTDTRTADVPSIAISDISGFSITEGTILVEYNFPILTGEQGMLLQIDDGTGDNRIYIEKLADETIRATIRASASTTFQFTSTETFSAGVSGKVALTWKANDSNAAFNGEIGTTDTGVTIPTGLTDLHIGTNHAGGLQPNGNCARISYEPYRTPDAELIGYSV
jgi:hypothetical protein